MRRNELLAVYKGIAPAELQSAMFTPTPRWNATTGGPTALTLANLYDAGIKTSWKTTQTTQSETKVNYPTGAY